MRTPQSTETTGCGLRLPEAGYRMIGGLKGMLQAGRAALSWQGFEAAPSDGQWARTWSPWARRQGDLSAGCRATIQHISSLCMFCSSGRSACRSWSRGGGCWVCFLPKDEPASQGSRRRVESDARQERATAAATPTIRRLDPSQRNKTMPAHERWRRGAEAPRRRREAVRKGRVVNEASTLVAVRGTSRTCTRGQCGRACPQDAPQLQCML